MRKLIGWAGLRTACVALAATVLMPVASADVVDSTKETDPITEEPTAPSTNPLIRYSTIGALSLDDSSITGENVLGFNSMINQEFTAPSNVSFGEFQIVPVGENISTTYENTKFQLTISFDEIEGGAPVPEPDPIVLTGYLNGTVTGKNRSNLSVEWELDPDALPEFQLGGYVASITKLDAVDIAPFSTNGGRTSIQGRIDARPIPEPASIAVFLAALAGGIGLRRRALARPVA